MDQLSAHLDRGWDRIQQGDSMGAQSSAATAVELFPESAEAHNLLGYVSALDGDCEAALEAYEQAMFLDDHYIEPMLNAAELLIHPMKDYEGARRMCDQILALSRYDDEAIDALLLKFEALFASGKHEEAKRLLTRLPDELPTPLHYFLAARAHHELGAHDEAAQLIGHSSPEHPEAQYYRGLIMQAQGEARKAGAAFIAARNLELQAGMPSWAPDANFFMQTIEQAAQRLAAPLLEILSESDVYVSDIVGSELIVDGVDLHAMVVAEPFLPIATAEDEAPPPGLRVFIYALSVMRNASGIQDLEDVLYRALADELQAATEELIEFRQQLMDLPATRKRRMNRNSSAPAAPTAEDES